LKIKPLPPLNSLVAFEAAARHLSFTRAGMELNVTQGAISRQIRHLEEYLGRSLFVRDKRNLSLTQTGEDYFYSIQQSLQLLANATADVLQWKDSSQITVATSNAMASLWLLPRLSEFQNRHPDIDVRIVASDMLKGVMPTEFDMALYYCRKPPAGMTATPLFHERVFPVCSPRFLENQQLEKAEDIFSTTLLLLDSGKEWMGWNEWFQQMDLNPAPPRRRLTLNNYPMLIQAALNGQGVSLGWEQLISNYLESGLLVRPVPVELNTEACFYMLEPEVMHRRKSGVDEFRSWLLDRVAAEELAVGEAD